MVTWNEPDEIWRAPPRDIFAIPRGILRILTIIIATVLLFLPYIAIRFGQRIFGRHHAELRIVQLWAKITVWSFGLKIKTRGKVQIKGGLITSNHINFLDIPIILSVVPGFMISKAEVRKWPVIGWFANLVGTEFVVRDPSKTAEQVASLSQRIERGDRLIIFPEATTTDGQRVINFRSSFFQAISQVKHNANVEPLTIYYHAPKGASRNFFGYWGDANFGHRMWVIICNKGFKRVDLEILDPLPHGLARKEMALEDERVTRAAFTALKEGADRLRED